MARRWLPFPYERRLMLDLCHFSRAVPTFPVEMTFELNDLVIARQQSSVRISWMTLFLRAMAILSTEDARLRQSFLAWPWPRLYEHVYGIASVTIARERHGQPFVGFARIENPGARDLPTLQLELDRFRQRPVEEAFREQFHLCRYPGVVRRAIWRLLLNACGRKRSRKFGTFGITTVAGQGVTNRLPPSVLPFTLSYAPLDAQGKCLVTLLCDHRLVDGVQAAEVLQSLHATMRGQLLTELRALGPRQSRAA